MKNIDRIYRKIVALSFNEMPLHVFGFELFDKDICNNIEFFLFGRRVSGYFKIATLDGGVVHNSGNYKKLKLLEKSKTFLITKKRSGISLPCLKTGVSMPSFR